jgi:hypothetical protein
MKACNSSWKVLAGVALAMGIIGGYSVLLTRCSAAQVACPVIDLADKACETIVLKYVDKDGVEREVPVPKEELVAVGEVARARKAAPAASSGAAP